MPNPQILIGEEIREMTDDEVKNYLQIISDSVSQPDPE
jgi:hypothetical protein